MLIGGVLLMITASPQCLRKRNDALWLRIPLALDLEDAGLTHRFVTSAHDAPRQLCLRPAFGLALCLYSVAQRFHGIDPSGAVHNGGY